MDPLKILYLCTDPGIPVLGRKGAAVHVRAMADAFRRAGHSVVLAAPVLTKSPWEEPARFDVPLVHLPLQSEDSECVAAAQAFFSRLGLDTGLPGELRRILYNQQLPCQLEHRFRDDPPDFIYERVSLYGSAGAHLAQALHRPLLLELNAPLAFEQATYRETALGDLGLRAERAVLSRASAVFVVSEPLRNHVISEGVAADRIHVLPNGVDPALFHPGPRDARLRSRWGLNGGPVLGFVGGLRPWHDVDVFGPLLDRLVPRHGDVRLVIVGHGPLRGRIESDLERRGFASRVTFTGALSHEEVAALTREFDVALAPYPPADHAFYFSPLKLFEYMACGVAVVAARVGQIAQVVKEGETGLLYPPGDLDALASACDRLLSDAALRRRLSEAASKEIRSCYTWDRNAERAVEIGRGAIERGAAP